MVYSNRFVLSVLHKGIPQKELANGVVKLPFESEYSLRFRNRNNKRAVVKFFIDGENVSGNGYIIPANSYINIERHYDIDKAFKFVSLDSEDAIEFGKSGPNDDKVKGTIEARFYLEKEIPQVKEIHHHHWPKPYNPWTPVRPYYPPICFGSDIVPINYTCGTSGDNSEVSFKSTLGGIGGSSLKADYTVPTKRSLNEVPDNIQLSCESTPSTSASNMLQDGCTVEGNSTGQSFYSQYIETENSYTTLKVFLQGYTENKVSKSVSKKKTLKELEKENEELRRKLAEKENEELKRKLNE